MVTIKNPKLIRQKHSKGCGMACIAMITGERYDDIHQKLFGSLGKVWGMYRSDVVRYLSEKGFSPTDPVYPLRDNITEIKPFAQWHLVETKVYPDSESNHFIVMTQDGKLLDPILGETSWDMYCGLPCTITGFNW